MASMPLASRCCAPDADLRDLVARLSGGSGRLGLGVRGENLSAEALLDTEPVSLRVFECKKQRVNNNMLYI